MTRIILRLPLHQARAMRRALRPDTLKPTPRRAALRAADSLDAAIARAGQAHRPRVIDRTAVMRMVKRGLSDRAIADKLGCSRSGVLKIRRGL